MELKKLKRIIKRMMIAIVTVILLLIIGILAYMQHPKFGKTPGGERLERIQKSKHYKDGAFQNLSETPQLAEGYTMRTVLWDFLFKKYPNTYPVDSIPSVKTDLKNLNPDEDVFIWFGHSSYFIQLEGKKYLIDPVFSGNASPVPGTTKSFPGTDIYSVEDLPDIDFLLITHDHYDHLDYETIKKLKSKVNKVITGLGVGAHLEYWGYQPETIKELDWDESIELDAGTTLYAVPARHFSGRTFQRNTSLWLSFVLKTPHKKIFIGGDSGYDTHFAKIGNEHGPFDFAILENGQYDVKWKYIHFLPEEAVQAAKELKTKKFIPVHNSKFKLGNHPWNEPMIRIIDEADKQGMPYATPKIGEKLNLNDSVQVFTKWWVGLE